MIVMTEPLLNFTRGETKSKESGRMKVLQKGNKVCNQRGKKKLIYIVV